MVIFWHKKTQQFNYNHILSNSYRIIFENECGHLGDWLGQEEKIGEQVNHGKMFWQKEGHWELAIP